MEHQWELCIHKAAMSLRTAGNSVSLCFSRSLAVVMLDFGSLFTILVCAVILAQQRQWAVVCMGLGLLIREVRLRGFLAQMAAAGIPQRKHSGLSGVTPAPSDQHTGCQPRQQQQRSGVKATCAVRSATPGRQPLNMHIRAPSAATSGSQPLDTTSSPAAARKTVSTSKAQQEPYGSSTAAGTPLTRITYAALAPAGPTKYEPTDVPAGSKQPHSGSAGPGSGSTCVHNNPLSLSCASTAQPDPELPTAAGLGSGHQQKGVEDGAVLSQAAITPAAAAGRLVQTGEPHTATAASAATAGGGASQQATCFTDLPQNLQTLIMAQGGAPLDTCRAGVAVIKDPQLLPCWLLAGKSRPLMVAARRGLWGVCCDLLNSSRCRAEPVDLRFALVKAAAAGHEGVIRGLLDAGVCEPAHRSEEPEVHKAASLAFNTAAERGHLGICRLMLECRVALQPDTLSKALMSSASNPQSTALLQLLLEKGVDANAGRNGFDSSSTPLGKAIDAENMEAVRLLLKHGAPLRNGFCTGFSALHSAVYTGNKELIRLLVQHGAKDPDSGAMQHAIRTGKWGIVEVLMGGQRAAG